jgi:hypothetical protein
MTRIELPHKVCGKTCMVNGLEDLYEWKTGERLPDWLLFYVSGMAGFVYLKVNRSPIPRLVGWGTVPKSQYKTLAPIVGFEWSILEGRSFSFALQRAKEHIDRGTPVILGAIDMYHLPYYDQFYHKTHVPLHYVLMVGYDDERELVLVHDCDRAEIQEIPYTDLELAWDIHVPGMSKKNTFLVFEFDDRVADAATIVHEGMLHKAKHMLEPPTAMFGVKGMRKLARELPRWPEELSADSLDTCLRNLVEYTGFPPAPPNRLTGCDEPDNHTAGRDGFADLLARLAGDYDRPAWAEAASLFEQSGAALEDVTDAVVDVILGRSDTLEPAAELVAHIADLEEQAYRLSLRNHEM